MSKSTTREERGFRSRPPIVRTITTTATLVFACSCNLWDIGRIDLPRSDHPTDSVALSNLKKQDSEEQTLEQGVESLSSREPKSEDAPPREIASLNQPLIPMSISDLRMMVLSGNLDLQVVRIAPELADLEVSKEQGKFDAVIGGRLRYDLKDSTPLNSLLVSFDPLGSNPALDKQRVKFTELAQESDVLDFGLGVVVPLTTGGKVALEQDLDRKNVFSPENFDEYRAATRFSISQPLLRGAGTTANLAGIRIARAGARITRLKTKLAAMGLLAKAEKGYWKLYAARQMLEVRAEQYRLASENLDLVRARVAEQVTAGIEIPRAQAGVAKRLESLIVAGTTWRIQQRALKGMLASDALPLNAEPMIEPTTDPLLAGIDLDAEAMARTALHERLELIALEVGLVQDGLRIDLERNRALPIANLDFKYGIADRDTQSFGLAWQDQWDFDNDEFSAGVTFAVPFTNQRNRARLESALLYRAQRLASREARRLKVRQEVYDAVDMVRQNWQRILAARQNVIVAGRNYDVERTAFLNGTRTQREVLEALSDLGEAQLKEIKAITEYQVAQIDLAFATGTLLGYSRVDLAPLDLPDRNAFRR